MKSLPNLSRILAALIVLALLATACNSDPSDTSSANPDPDSDQNNTQDEGNDRSGSTRGGGSELAAQQMWPRIDDSGDTQVIITLDNASGNQAETIEREAPLEGDPLTTGGVAQLLNEFPDLEEGRTEQVDFNRPPNTRPRPRPGSTVEALFPPPVDAQAPETPNGPLEVLRFQPEGPVDLAPFISVTFNQPMVSLSTVSQIEDAETPITITPEMPGRWIWLGTKTVRFEYGPGAIDRIPAATRYVVRVPAGTVAANGAELADDIEFEFSTPTPHAESVTPMHESLSTEPVFFIQFDQRVNSEAVLGVIDLYANGNDVSIRLATGDEVSGDNQIASLAENALVDRWVAVRPVEPLPTNAVIRLDIGPKVPSAEGPETSSDISSHSGRTYGPFRVTDAYCDYGDQCEPGSSFQIQMSNPIDADIFRPDMITVKPAIPGMQIRVNWNQITVQGLTAGRTDYQVTVGADLTDIYAQELAEPMIEEFQVGDAQPALFRPGRSLVTLDPIVDNQQLGVTSINNEELDITVYQVDPVRDWQTFNESHWAIARGEHTANWAILDERRVTATGEDNTFTETAIDLSSQLAISSHLVVVVGPSRRNPDDWRNEPFAVWVQNTKLGLDAITDNQQAVAWVTDLTTGEGVPGATVEIIGGSSATTDADGIAKLQLADRASGMLAKAGGDVALIGEFWAQPWDRTDQLRWYIIEDRGLYKPGETASLKGWVRQADFDVPADLSLPSAGGTVTWLANDEFGNEIGSGKVDLSPQGGFDLEVELPDDITLGSATVQFSTNAFRGADNASTWHVLRVQEFRRPDFEVTAEVAGSGPYLAGTTFAINAQADYFAGGAIASSPVGWNVSGNVTSYSPPNWPEYSFGIWVPWWLSFNEFAFTDEPFDGGGGFGGGTNEFFSGTTDAGGEHGLDITIDTEGKPRPVRVTASATVTDVTRQSITGSASALVHPADLYVGIKGARTFVQAGERLDLDLIVTDIDGIVVSGQTVTVESVRLEWQFQSGSWTEAEIPDEVCEVTSADDATVCSFRPSEGGRYRMSATVTDSSGRTNLSELTRWVAGGERRASRRVDLEELTLIPNGQDYQPGDTAEILVQSPFVDAHGLLVVSRGTIDRIETIEFDDAGTAIVQLPITSDDIPGLGLQFEVVGTAERSSNDQINPSLPARPAYASGRLTLNVPADERELTIDVAPRLAKLVPGAATKLDIVVTDADGEPVADAELAVIIVDEAVLSLTNYQLHNPLDAFYARNSGPGQVFRGRATLLLSDPATIFDGSDTNGGAQEEMLAGGFARAEDGAVEFSMLAAPEAALAAPEAAIELRTNFNALAVFEPEVTTNSYGRAVIDVPLADNLTRYRVMVVATAGPTHAGTGESNITAQLPVTVRPTPPRFANFGDVFEFPVIVQNTTDEPLDIDVALRSTNLSINGRAGTTVTVPANDRVEVRFHVSAVEAGLAQYLVVASAGLLTDAVEGEFPVYTPATAEAFATYGFIDSGSIAQPFTEPQDVFPQFGGLEISTSSTAIASLTDALLYLSDYRYENSDAFASRIIAIVSLDDILTAFDAEGLPSPDELRSVINNDINRLSSMQNNDGGFPYWRRGRESIPYNTVQATHALVLAKQEGNAVDEQVLEDAKFYLANIEDFYPDWYHESTRRSISAYALHVRFLAGDRDIYKATSLYKRAGGDIELDVAAWLWPVVANTELDNAIELLLNNRVTETPDAATFATSYGEQAYVFLHSDRRTDAIVLDALIAQRPDSDLVTKTLTGLLAARDHYGHWRNAQENSFVLLAGSAYFHRFESVDPNFIARAWLGETYTLEHAYEGRVTDRNLTVVPMAELIDVGDTNIVLSRDGIDGRLYYRLGLRYAPIDFDLDARDQGFVVQRTYEAIDDDTDVVRNNDGTWAVRAGARVRVRLTMVVDSRRTHVALIDPIPAGFEIVNSALATSEPAPQADPSETASNRFWWSRWFEHQNLRDDRAEAFSTWLGAGSYEYTYIARATTPGTFVTPPARAQQIYEPEVFGRSASTTVTVTDS